MKSIKIRRTVTTIALAAILGLLFTQCNPKQNEAEANDASVVAPSDRVYPVKVATVSKQMIAKTIDYTANLTPFEEVHLATAQPGQIDAIYVEVGDRVEKGDVLVEMDPTQLLQAKIQLNDATTNLERLDTLIQVGGIPKQQYDQVKMQYDLAKSNVQFLEQNTILTAPISGVITGKYYENEELFGGAPNTQAGKAAIVSIQQINPLKAIVGVSEKFFPLVYTGMKVSVSCDIYPNEIFTGKVSLIHPTISPLTRTFMVEITVPNNEELLRSGMFSRVKIAMGEEEALVLPALTIMQQEGTNERFVFVNRNNVAKRINVVLGKRFDGMIEVISDDLHVGDQLIVAGQKNLLDGYKVEVVAD